MRYKIVNDGYVKGIILTAESLMSLEDEVKECFSHKSQKEQLEGALLVVETLKQSYRKIK